MNKYVCFLTVCLLIVLSGKSHAQDSTWTRKYQLSFYNQNDLRISSTNGLAVNRVLQDTYRKEIKSRMNEKMGNITAGIFSFTTTYMTMIWSHEFGHSLRANQVGGEFRIHNANLPIPYTTMHLPDDLSYVDVALSVTGGFEVNHLNIRKIQREFIAQNGTFNEDLGYAFANRLMHTIYTSLVVPINPEEREVWINTAGDPVHCILPVFKNYSNDKVFMEDETVNPELVKYYNQSSILGTFFNLLDPQFYKEVGATFGKMDKVRRPTFLIGNYENGWTYGTLFNVSPLGYELYMNNYLHIKGQQFSFYAKYGNPFKNNGLGIQWANMIDRPSLKMSSTIDLWDQDIFGNGIAAEIEADYTIFKNIALNASLGYKTKGYVLGKQIDKGLNFGFGLVYYANY